MVVELDDASVRDAARKIRARGLESVAVCLINAHMNPAHEERIRDVSGVIHDAGGADEQELGVMRSRGALIRFWEGGGGGWGDPRTRPAEWVLDDVIDGFVSLAAAREIYGVAVRCVDEDTALYEIDHEATLGLRAP